VRLALEPAAVAGRKRVRPYARQRFGGGDQSRDQLVRQRFRERAVAGRVGGRVLAVPAAERDLPARAVNRERDAEPLARRRFGDPGEQQPVQVAGPAPEHPRGVPDVDADRLLLGNRQVQGFQPPCRTRAPGRVDHQVRARLPAVGGLDPVDPLGLLAGEPSHVGVRPEGDVGDALNPLADKPFQ
jgi:hypothetical protein